MVSNFPEAWPSINKETYEDPEVVKEYAKEYYLQAPEKTILEKFKSQLKQMRFLDIGVGAGRTTLYFADFVKEYIGVDYSTSMIEICKSKFLTKNNVRFDVCDVTSMVSYDNDYFDFILFSYNGIDYISHEDRIKALQEINRVGKPGALFLFSSHNLACIERLFKFRMTIHPLIFFNEIKRMFRIRSLNNHPEKLKEQEYAIINDGARDFRLTTYYIQPLAQIGQLKENGFEHISVYSLNEGQEIKENGDMFKAENRWLYYFCNIRKSINK